MLPLDRPAGGQHRVGVGRVDNRGRVPERMTRDGGMRSLDSNRTICSSIDFMTKAIANAAGLHSVGFVLIRAADFSVESVQTGPYQDNLAGARPSGLSRWVGPGRPVDDQVAVVVAHHRHGVDRCHARRPRRRFGRCRCRWWAGPSRRRDCHFADVPSTSLLKHLLKGEAGAAE